MKRIVVFNSTHYGNTLDVLCYRLIEHKDDRCIFLQSGYWKSAGGEYILNLKSNGLFDEVYLYDSSPLYNNKDDLVGELCGFFEKIQEDLGVDFSETVNYSTSDVDDPFAMYLLSKKYPLIILTSPMMNEGLTECRYENLYSRGLVSEEFYTLQKELGALQGERGGCKVVAPMGMRADIVYDYKGIVGRLTEDERRCIVKSFNNCPVVEGDMVLVLTNSHSFVADHVAPEQMPDMFTRLVDYYVPKGSKYLLKPHPYSPDYSKRFDKQHLMPSNILVDVFRYMDGVRISKAISVATSSSDKISDIVDTNVVLSGGFFPNYRLLHIIADLVDKLGGGECEVYQDFMHDCSFVQELARARGAKFNFKPMPTPENDHFLMFTTASYHIGNLDIADHFSVFYIDLDNSFDTSRLPKRKYCIKRKYTLKRGLHSESITAYLFTNDPVLKSCLHNSERQILPHSKIALKITVKDC